MIAILNPTQSVFVKHSEPASNFNGESVLSVGVGSAADHIYITLLQFNLEPYIGAIINAATLRLYSRDYDAYQAEETFYVKRNVAAWAPASATYNNKPATTTTNSASLHKGGYNEWYVWNVAAMIQNLTFGAENYGFSVMQATATALQKKNFYRTGTYAPRLVLDYTPAGLSVIDDSGEIKRTLVWVNDNGEWKQAIVYGNDGTWKQGV